MTVSADGAADRFWLKLEALYQAADKPTLKRLVRLGMEQRPPISVSDSTINGWLNRKAVPTGRKNEHYLAVMVSFLQARARADSRYEPLSEGEWGGLLHKAQTERAGGKKNGRPRRATAPSRGLDAYGQWRSAAGEARTGLDRGNRSGRAGVLGGLAGGQPSDDGYRNPTTLTVYRALQARDLLAGCGGLRGTRPSGIIGRDCELAMLAGLAQTVAAGGGGAVLIEGEPGIGKSALVRAALAGAAGLGCQVFWGAGDELDQALPLQPLLDGLRVRELSADPRRHAIARLLRGEAATDRSADVSAVLAEQLLALVAECCAVRPTVLVIDDLQWADQASITAWGRLARSARQMPLLLVGMMRPVPRREGLLALRRVAGGAFRLRLTPLTRPAVADLVATLTGGKPDGRLLELADGAAGNPLYLTELVAALIRSASVTITDSGVATVTAGSVPGSLSAAIADRIGFVTGPVREVLRAAALLGVEFAVTDLGIVLGRNARDLAWALEEACAAGVLAASGKRLGFRHPLIQTALYDEMPAPVRSALHREAGRALAEAGASADRVARQMLRACGEPGSTAEPMDEWMLAWLTRTADLLLGQAPGAAAELLTRAVASLSAGSALHGWLASRLADALYRIGDRAQAEQVANRVLGRATEPDLLVDLHWTLAQCRALEGLPAESLATLDRALSSPGISSRHRARLLALAARMHGSLGELGKGGEVAARALAAASEAGDDWATGWALLDMALVTVMQGHITDALPLFDQALTVTQSDPALTDLRLLLQINKAIALGQLDRDKEALAVAGQARHLADQAGTTVRLAQARSVMGQLLFGTGRWDEALTEVTIMPEDLKEPGAACCDLGIAAVISFHRDETAMARRYLAAAVPYARRIGNRLIGPLALARSLDREHDGALPDALAALTAGLNGNTEELEEMEDLLTDSVRLAMETGNVSTAQSLVGYAAALATGPAIPRRQANALYCRGLLNHDASCLIAGAKRYDDANRPLLHAKSLEAAAGEFIRTGNLDQARAAFAKATGIYAWLGATMDAARLTSHVLL
jgi:tetratricopeptide (TPR) repeat protein